MLTILIVKILLSISAFLKALWLYIAGITGLLAMYFILVKLEQGIDVVIQVGEYTGHALWALVCIALWAFLAGYSSRLVSYARQKHNDDIPAALHRHFPRLIAYNCFVCIQMAILALPAFYHLNAWIMLLFILFHNLLYFAVSAIWGKPPADRSMAFFIWALIIVYAAWLVYLIISKKNYHAWYARYPYGLAWVMLGLFAGQLVAIKLFIERRKNIDRRMSMHKPDGQRLTEQFSFDPRYNGAEQTNFNTFNAISLAAATLYCVAIFSLKLSANMGPMAFVLLAIGILIGFSNFITYCSVSIHFNLAFVFLIWAFLIGLIKDPYQVRLLSTGKEKIFDKRPDSRTYFRSWLMQRRGLLDKAGKEKFEVYIVLSDGGASRSANWVSGMLSRIQDQSYRIDPGNSFADHLLCMAGASGGSVGNCAFYSLLKAHAAHPDEALHEHSLRFFATDFLTFTLGRLMGPDFFRHLVPLNTIDDRAAALEMVMAQGSKDSLLNTYFSKPLSEVFDYSGKLPVLFINSTRVDDGKPGEISSIKLPAGSQRIDMLHLIDSNALIYGGGNDLRLATAAVLSARFPYVSPAGNILNNYFVDGGYFDNSGSGIVLEYMQELKTILRDSSDSLIRRYAPKLHFSLIQIYNGSVIASNNKKPMHPLVNDMLTPILTLEGTQGSSTRVANGILDRFFTEFNGGAPARPIQFSLYDSLKNKEEDYPMSWVISDYNRERMKMRIDTVFAKSGIIRELNIER